jgi:hypothetical protein
MKLGVNMALFFIFFGIALIEAIQGNNWLAVGVFLALGLFCLYADNLKKGY